MNIGSYFSPRAHVIWRFWREELAPARGRMEFTLRVVVTCLAVIVISNALQLPYLSLSMLATIVVVQANAVYTKLISIVIIIAMLINLAAVIIILKLFYSDPMLRVVVSIFVFFVFIYLVRAAALGVLLMPAAATIMMMMAIPVDLPDVVVRAMLWIWVALSYPCFVSMLINTFMFPGEPSRQLREEMVNQMTGVIDRLSALSKTAEAVSALPETVLQRHATALQQILNFLKMREAANVSRYLYLQACAATVTRMEVCANALLSLAPRPERFEEALADLCSDCKAFRQALVDDRPFTVTDIAAFQSSTAEEGALIREGRNCLHALAQFDANAEPPPQKQALPMLVDATFWSAEHLHFALKVTLVCTIGYIFYNAVQWDGIHTITLTGILVVYPMQLGWTMRRMVWRIVGALLGSLWALVLIIFVFPHLDSIVGLLLAVTPMLFMGAWIMVGSERITYVGFQLITTASLALFTDLKAPTDLVEVRDRLVGILLGVALSAFVYTQIWPDSESSQLRGKLAGMLKDFGALIKSITEKESTGNQIAYAQKQQKCWGAINECEEILIRVSLEPEFLSGPRKKLVPLAHELLGRCRAMLITQEKVRAMFPASDDAVPPAVLQTVQETLEKVDDVLTVYAAALVQGVPPTHKSFQKAAEMLDEMSKQGKRSAVTDELLSCTEKLARLVVSLPDWADVDTSRKTQTIEATP